MSTRGIVLAALLALGAACTGSKQAGTTPATSGVKLYLEALQSDDPRAAYDLLAAETRAELTYDEFQRLWKESAGERARQVSTLEEGLRETDDLDERATVRYPDGKEVILRRQEGAWRLGSGLVTRTHAARPHDAVEIFAGALARRSVDDVLRILTTRRRQGIERQLDAFVESLEKHLASAGHEIYLVGSDRAELTWRDGDMSYKLILRAEDGEWRIDDVHLMPGPSDEDTDEDADEGDDESDD